MVPAKGTQMNANLKKTVVALALAAACGASMATTSTYDFGSYFTGTGPTTPATFASLSVTTTDNLLFYFDLKIFSNLTTVFGSGAFVSALKLNTASNAEPISSAIDSGIWGVSKVALNTSPSNTGSVAWDFQDSFCGGNNCNNSNNSLSRLTGGEEVKWTTTFASAQTPLFGDPSMILKVQGYGNSAEYTPTAPIPEPETYAMMLAGLGLMGLVGSRRRRISA